MHAHGDQVGSMLFRDADDLFIRPADGGDFLDRAPLASVAGNRMSKLLARLLLYLPPVSRGVDGEPWRKSVLGGPVMHVQQQDLGLCFLRDRERRIERLQRTG